MRISGLVGPAESVLEPCCSQYVWPIGQHHGHHLGAHQQTLRLHSDLLNQNVRFNRSLGDLLAHQFVKHCPGGDQGALEKCVFEVSFVSVIQSQSKEGPLKSNVLISTTRKCLPSIKDTVEVPGQTSFQQESQLEVEHQKVNSKLLLILDFLFTPVLKSSVNSNIYSA